MKTIASWTQTYGDKRILNFQLLKYDTLGNYFRNKCDYIIFSFHNCPDSFYNECELILKTIYSAEKLFLLRYNNCSYLQTYKNIIQKTRELKCTDIFPIQDDQHCINSKNNLSNINDIDEIITTYKNNNKIIHLHIFEDESIPKNGLVPLETIKINNLEIYKYNSTHFKNCKIYAWNDGAHIINIDVIDKLINLQNFPEDVWRMEMTLKQIYDNNVFYRWGTNKILFKASNLFGRNINRDLSPIQNLQRFFGETDNWKEIVNIIVHYLNK